MKDKRNCSTNMSYPIYQQPMMVPPMGYPTGYPAGMINGSNNLEQQINNLEQQINLLDQRVNRLENLGTNSTTNNYTKYNDSNYYMV